ncbi:MAG: bifunctional oligoribonuclease/PAP phosphatase NrnA [Gemmatimonadetes bacterium]|nr:bifunctional oligoribonuclease/PAP phosphatase NrnA [Gemmatimonadota bacterium]
MEIPDLQAARLFLEQGDDFILTSHVNSDGDGIGGCLALRALLTRMGKKATILLDGGADDYYDFMEGWDTIQRAGDFPPCRSGYLIVLDCPNLERIGDTAAYVGDEARILNIDHHQDNLRFGEANLVADSVSSTCEMIYHLTAALEIEIDAGIAAHLYTGILYDTGGFRYSLTKPSTFDVAAALVRCGIRLDWFAAQLFDRRGFAQVKQLGQAIESLELHLDGCAAVLVLDNEQMRAGDPEDVVNYGLVRGVEVSVLLKEEESGEFRISLRSRDRIDVSQVAARFGGGGHTKASGCRLSGDRETVRQQLLDVIAEQLNE